MGVATRRRLDGLRLLVRSLAAQTALEDLSPTLVVVDNDPEGSAREVVDDLRDELGWPVVYTVEPDPGIPAVRRAVVEQAIAADCDALVFVDDDEEAPPEWLATLVHHWRTSGADAVTGPVRRRLPADAPAWTRTSDFFDTTGKHRTGARMSKGYTGNALVSRAVLDRIVVPFDDTFRFTGSSDLHFFLRVVREGFLLEWCEEALVEENIAATRLSWSWYVRRAYRSGAGDAVARRLITPGPRSVLGVLALATVRTAHGVVLAPVSLVRPELRSLAVRRTASGVGTVAGLFGRNYEEYLRRGEESE